MPKASVQPKKAAKPKRQRNRKRKNGASNGLAMMIKEPCTAPLVHGLYGDIGGFPTKYKRTRSFPSLGAGYAVWFPQMGQASTNPGLNANGSSCFLWGDANPAANPTNTIANPYGNAASVTSAQTIPVAGDQFTQSSVCATQRTLTACMKLRYTGRMDATEGEVAVLSGLTVSQLLGISAGGGADVPIDVDEIFQLAQRVERLSLDGHEARWRPTQSSHTFIQSPVQNSNVATGSAFKIGTTGVNTTSPTPEAHNLSPEALVIAWRGTQVGANLVLEHYLGLEWIPNPTEGLTQPEKVDIGPSDTFSSVLRGLDRASHAWDTAPPSVKHGAATMAAGMAQAGMRYFASRGNGYPRVN